MKVVFIQDGNEWQVKLVVGGEREFVEAVQAIQCTLYVDRHV